MSKLSKVNLNDGDAKKLPKAVVKTAVHDTFKVSMLTCQPGWKWSECIKPLVGTDSCQVAHQGIVTSGGMTVRMDDGTEQSYGPGDTFYIPPGHDGWVTGDEVRSERQIQTNKLSTSHTHTHTEKERKRERERNKNR